MNDSFSKFGHKIEPVTPAQENFERVVRLEVLVVAAVSAMRELGTQESRDWLKEAAELLHMGDPAIGEPPNPPYSGIVVVDEADFTRGEE